MNRRLNESTDDTLAAIADTLERLTELQTYTAAVLDALAHHLGCRPLTIDVDPAADRLAEAFGLERR